MDTIFFNGCIRTLDNSEKVAEAVGIENGRIVFVGTDKEAEAFSCKKRIDLKGRLMLPGFVDTHMHMLHYAFVERSVKLFDCTSVEEMLAADNTQGSWAGYHRMLARNIRKSDYK